MKPKDIEGILKVSNAMIKKNVEQVDKKIDKMEYYVKDALEAQERRSIKAIERAEKTKDGLNGKDGVNGKDGKNGIDGKNGLDGKNGKDGRNGIDGRNGKDGINGRDGVGKDGKDGQDGRSAYELAVKNGYKGTEKEWLESLKAELNMIPNQAVAGYTNPLPPRGTTGQVLAKKSNQDRDYAWVDQSGGGSSVVVHDDTLTGEGTALSPLSVVEQGEPKLDNDRLITKDPTGFTNNDNIDVSYNPTTKKITLTGDFQAYCSGTLIPELVSGWQSPAISDAVPSGAYFLKYGETGFIFDNSPFDFSCLQIAYVYYRADGTYLFTLRETHSFMDWRSHQEFHQTIGTYRLSGGILTGYTAQSTTATNRRPDTPQTTIKDEDLTTINPAHTSKQYTIAYLQASGAITSDFNNDEIVRPETGIPNYNLFTGGVWTQSPMYTSGAARYMSMWQYAKPVGSDAGSVRYQYVWLQGQTAGDLASQTNANPQDLNLGGLADIVSELVFINQAIIRYRGGGTSNWDIYSVKSLTGNKYIQTSLPSGVFLSSVATDATLTGDGTVSNPLSVVPVADTITSVFTRTGAVVATSGDYSLDQITQSASYRTVTDTEKSTWNGKQDLLVSNTNIKTVNGETILGTGNITVSGAVGASTAYFLTSPFSNSTTTLQDVTEWTFPVVSGKKYRVEIIGTYQTNTTTTGGKLAIYARDSAVTTINGAMYGSISDVQVATEIKATIYACAASNATGSFLLTTGVATINRPHAIGGQMVIACTTSGNVRFQWAGEAATAAQLNTGSVLIVTPLN